MNYCIVHTQKLKNVYQLRNIVFLIAILNLLFFHYVDMYEELDR